MKPFHYLLLLSLLVICVSTRHIGGNKKGKLSPPGKIPPPEKPSEIQPEDSNEEKPDKEQPSPPGKIPAPEEPNELQPEAGDEDETEGNISSDGKVEKEDPKAVEAERKLNLKKLKSMTVDEPNHAVKVEELEEKLTKSYSDVEKDSEEKFKTLFEVNDEVASKQKDGIIKIPGMRGSHVNNGDIIYGECEEEELFGTTNMPNPKCDAILKKTKKRLAAKKAQQKDIINIENGNNFKWPTTLPYTFKNITDTADNFMDQFKHAFNRAVWDYGNKSCIRFRLKRPADTDWLDFQRGIGCNTQVGNHRVGAHVVNLQAQDCDHPVTVSHEVLHALGFWHEQSRTDRDAFVHIEFANVRIQDGWNMSHNFDMATDSHTLGYDYDYKSIMHYPRTAFGIQDVPPNNAERQTIFPLQNNIGRLGGFANDGLSVTDALQLNARYCNSPLANVQAPHLRTLARRWMMIYSGHTDKRGLAQKFVLHLQQIYQNYYFMVMVQDQLQGNNPRRLTRGQCATVREFQIDLTVCYLRVNGNPPRNLPSDNVVKAALDNQSCDVNGQMNRLRGVLPGRQIAAFKAIPFGYNAVGELSNNAVPISYWINFQCQGRNGRPGQDASVVFIVA